MTVKRISLIILSAMTISCNQGTAIVLTNKSNVDKKITVTYPRDFTFSNNKDSLQAWDLSNTENEISMREVYRHSLKIPFYSDTSRRILSFNLKAGHEVTVLDQPTSLSTIKKIYIVANNDTLNSKRKGGCWTYMIKN